MQPKIGHGTPGSWPSIREEVQLMRLVVTILVKI